MTLSISIDFEEALIESGHVPLKVLSKMANTSDCRVLRLDILHVASEPRSIKGGFESRFQEKFPCSWKGLHATFDQLFHVEETNRRECVKRTGRICQSKWLWIGFVLQVKEDRRVWLSRQEDNEEATRCEHYGCGSSNRVALDVAGEEVVSPGEVGMRVLEEARIIPQAQGLILNTFEHLDGLILPHLRKLCPNIYTIGPLHSLHKARLVSNMTPTIPEITFSNSVWKEDRTCLVWLDQHPPKTVVYVSIGSLAILTFDQLIEIWYGLVNSKKPFLWVRRPGSIAGVYDESMVPIELLEATKEMGCIVNWAPQEDVLAHRAIGGFLTHCGWNSTLESIVQGFPMICWPFYVDQLVNSRFVGEVWNVRIDIKDTCNRLTVEKAVRDVMDLKQRPLLNQQVLGKILRKNREARRARHP
ncbi:7-deoxyloganetic acid glucosyltransferase-like protein [Tanacetum coccineum]